MPATRIGSPGAIGVARLVRARHVAEPTDTKPSGSTASMAVPSWPIIHSRPIVGVANRVRTIEGMPTMNVRLMPPIPAMSASHEGRIEEPGIDSNRNQLPITVNTMPTPVQNRGIPTWTSIANAIIASMIRTTAHVRVGSTARPVKASTVHTAPTAPAMPTPAVKNSKIKSASPVSSSRYATGGLATVWNS